VRTAEAAPLGIAERRTLQRSSPKQNPIEIKFRKT